MPTPFILAPTDEIIKNPSGPTPGPWTYNGRSLAVYASNTRVACVDSRDTGRSFSEADANARLIAAAPELLVACKNVLLDLEIIETYPTCNRPGLRTPEEFAAIGVVRQLRAAIAKAEGGAP